MTSKPAIVRQQVVLATKNTKPPKKETRFFLRRSRQSISFAHVPSASFGFSYPFSAALGGSNPESCAVQRCRSLMAMHQIGCMPSV